MDRDAGMVLRTREDVKRKWSEVMKRLNEGQTVNQVCRALSLNERHLRERLNDFPSAAQMAKENADRRQERWRNEKSHD